jgi:hypothetical protein
MCLAGVSDTLLPTLSSLSPPTSLPPPPPPPSASRPASPAASGPPCPGSMRPARSRAGAGVARWRGEPAETARLGAGRLLFRRSRALFRAPFPGALAALGRALCSGAVQLRGGAVRLCGGVVQLCAIQSSPFKRRPGPWALGSRRPGAAGLAMRRRMAAAGPRFGGQGAGSRSAVGRAGLRIARLR